MINEPPAWRRPNGVTQPADNAAELGSRTPPAPELARFFPSEAGRS
ncbi:MAG TPA: hypothetical protein VGB75_07930 [Jatrophihabitans sp.]